MNRFAPVLRQLDSELPLSQQARARVLLEVAADLDDAFELARRQGMAEAEAERVALEAFRPSEATVSQLVRIHGGLVACLLDGVSEQARSAWELTVLAVVALLVLVLSGQLVADLPLLGDGGVWAWLLAGTCGAALLVGAGKVYRLFVAQDQRSQKMRRGLGLMALLAALQAACGLGLVVADSYGWLTAMMTTLPGNPSEALAHLMRTSALATVALAGAVVSALAWFVISRRVARLEVQQAQLLLQLERSV